MLFSFFCYSCCQLSLIVLRAGMLKFKGKGIANILFMCLEMAEFFSKNHMSIRNDLKAVLFCRDYFP